MGNYLPLVSLVCDVLLRFCHFPMSCPGSGVVLDWSYLINIFQLHFYAIIVSAVRLHMPSFKQHVT